MSIRQVLTFIFLSAVVIFSFSFFALRFYPQLNSDDALNVLMTVYYKFPQDLYCWGQNRGGTLIVMMSRIFYGIGFSAITSVSISNYIILTLGYIGFSSLFKNRYTKLIFALLWFLPAFRFIYLLRYPIGVQYSLIAFAIFLLRKIDFANKSLQKNYLLLSSIIVLFIITIWVSDLALVTIGALVLVLYGSHLISTGKLKLRKDVSLLILSGLLLCFLFIYYAKSHAASGGKTYLMINGIDDIAYVCSFLSNVFISLLLFNTEELFFSIYCWMVIIFIGNILIISSRSKIRLSPEKKIFFFFFAADIIFVLITLVLSKWPLANHLDRRYFIGMYISAVMALLILLEHAEITAMYMKIMKVYLVLTAIVGTAGTFHVLKYIDPGSLRSEFAVRSELLQLGEIGIIAGYWNAYVSACPDPVTIKATPHSGAVLRSQEIVDEVFEQPKLYVIREGWLDKFPDTLDQFGYILQKTGKPFTKAGVTLHEYKQVKHAPRIISPDEFQCIPSIVKESGKFIISKDSLNAANRHVIWGPYIHILGKGNYRIVIKGTARNVESEKPIALFDAVAEYGRDEYGKKVISAADIVNDSFEVTMDFSFHNRCRNIEFRVYNYGTADLTIESIMLIEIESLHI